MHLDELTVRQPQDAPGLIAVQQLLPISALQAEAERLRVEAEAVKNVTGGGKVIIQPKPTSKLPGL